MANKDLRNWIDEIQNSGELHKISGAEPKEDIGGIVDIKSNISNDNLLRRNKWHF